MNRVAFFGAQYSTGGEGRVCSAIGKALARRQFDVDFLVDGTYSKDSYLQDGLPKNCRVVQLTSTRIADSGSISLSYPKILYLLIKYLKEEKPAVLISNLTKFNLLAVWASVISQVETSLVLVEHSLISPRITDRSHLLPPLIQAHYPFADKIIAVSEDVKKDLLNYHRIRAGSCTTIRNPVDVEKVVLQSIRKLDHDWFSSGAPVILGAGRFVEEKQFSVLLKAFEQLQRHTEVRLILAGRGPLREDLHELTVELGVEKHVDFLGFVPNPYKYMRRAHLLAISSKYEGCPVVALEALACGTPIVSTNCPGGNSDILNDGEYGELVDVGDPRGLADAMARTLDDPPDPDRLVERARHYDVNEVVDRYAEVIERAAN